MSDTPDVFTRKNLPRNELDKFFRDNPRIRKAFEDLLLDVGETLPQAIGGGSSDANSVLAQRAFDPRPLQRPPVSGDAAQILATQIFGA